MVCCDIVIIILVLIDLPAQLLHSIQIEETIFLGTIHQLGGIDHFAICTKFILTDRQQIVGTGYIIQTSHSTIAVADVVVITVLTNQALGHRGSVFQICNTIIAHKDTGMVGHIVADQHAFSGKLVQLAGIITFNQNGNVFVAIALPVECVCFAVNGSPHYVCVRVRGGSSAVEIGAKAEFGALFILNPCTHGAAVFIEGIENAVDSLLAHCQLVVGVSVALAAVVGILPAGDQLTRDGVVQVAVHLEDAGAGGIDLAATFIGADELTVNDLIVMGDLDLGDDGAPIDDGVAGLAVSTVLIASLSSGSFLIQNGQLLVVDMIGRRNGGQLGSNIDAAAEGVAINNTVNHFAFDIDSRLVAHFCHGIILTCNSTVAVIGPNTDRDTYQRILGCLTSGSIPLHRNGEQFGYLIVFESSLEAVGNNGALGLPLVGIVELQNCHQLVDAGQIRNIDVHIVDRLSLRSLAGVVMTAELNRRITCNSKCSGNSHGITKFVLNFKCNGVNTGSKSNVTL